MHEVKYLGVYLVSANHLKSSKSHTKVKFFRVFDCICSHSKTASSEIVTVQLLKAYTACHASESVSATQLHSLNNNCINRAVHRIFGVRNAECINDVQRFVALEDVAKLVENRRSKFSDRLIVSGKHVGLCLPAVHMFR